MSCQASRVPRYPSIAHLMTRGTFYDVGYNVGTAFGDKIKLFMAESEDVREMLLPFYDSRAGRDYYDESLRACQDCFPQYVRELRGVADGAGLAFEHVMMVNLSKEVYTVLVPQWERLGRPASLDSLSAHLLAQKPAAAGRDNAAKHEEGGDGQPREPEDTRAGHHEVVASTDVQETFGCSDVFINRAGCQYVVHNEDSDPLVKPYGFLLSAQLDEPGEAPEQFTAFCYPGYLPGPAWGFNVHGLNLSLDALYPDHVIRASPSRVFVNRALLRARDVPEVVRLAKNAPHGVAYGFAVNVSTKDGQMTSVEVAPGKPEGRVHVHDVIQPQDPAAPCHYYHFNAYKQLEMKEASRLASARQRALRSQELPPPRDLPAALRVMADDHDPQWPIFRTPRPTDRAETVITAAFDVKGRQVRVYQGREDLLADSPLTVLGMYQ